MQPFRKLGPYDLVERLAVGGMAEIYIARSRGVQGFSKEYVLKLIHPKFVGDADFIRMLVDEAKLVGQLTHSNIAQVIDLGIDGELYYILMEYVRGKDLFQILTTTWEQDTLTPVACAVFIAKEMASGLYYAHTKMDENGRPLNIVHRDVSPQNVLVSFQGEVKILDFGVAKAALGARPETRAGIIKGKFRYMSPEQAWGEKLDGRSDVFSVGLCLYEMLTGHPAYEDDGDMQKTLVRMRDAKFTPPSRLRPEVDQKLEGIVMKALARNREDRYATAHALEYDLARYLHLHHAGFTRKDIMVFLKTMFPADAVGIHVPDFTVEHGEIPLGTDELEVLDLEGTNDRTLRHSILRGAPGGASIDHSTDDFTGEETELYIHHEEPVSPQKAGFPELSTPTVDALPPSETAHMSNDRLQVLLDNGDKFEKPTLEKRRDEAFGSQSPNLRTNRGRRDPSADRTVPHEHDLRRDTVAGMIEKYMPPEAAQHALGVHEKFSDFLQTEFGRNAVVVVLGFGLGLFVLLLLVAAIV